MERVCYLHEGELYPEEGGEHEDEQDSSGELQVALGFVVTQSGDTGKQGFAFLTALGQDEEQGPDERQVAEEELKVPQDAVGYGLC